MKKGMKNTLCASMILVMAGAALAGCSKGGTKGAVKKVEDNGKPFYDSELIYFEKPEIKDGDDSVETSGNSPSLIDGK